MLQEHFLDRFCDIQLNTGKKLKFIKTFHGLWSDIIHALMFVGTFLTYCSNCPVLKSMHTVYSHINLTKQNKDGFKMPIWLKYVFLK